MKKYNYTVLMIAFALLSCGRKKLNSEVVWNDYVFEKDGIYYSVNCSTHSNYKKYTGCDTGYHDNWKIHGISNVVNGLPEGHWQVFDTAGKILTELFFKRGVLVGTN
jgi:antitoxin component YwqK of YwqJK toxin-antitoxin module